ncbi:MAG: DUF547 domain-containing protein [Acidobacteriota bacterium]
MKAPLLLIAVLMVGTTAAPRALADEFSHDLWARVLAQYVDDRGFVDYAGLAKNRRDLDRYIMQVESYSPASHPQMFTSRDHQLAYYLNAYNAQVFQGVLANGTSKSVWGFLGTGYGFFVGMDIVIGGKETNLKKLEDVTIREGFADPRIHAALNCASAGCPRLPQEPFLGDTLDAQLDAAMTEFATSENHVRLDAGNNKVAISKIFNWFEDDFLDEEKSRGVAKPNIVGYLNRYRGDAGPIPAGASVSYLPYDKGLNSQ